MGCITSSNDVIEPKKNEGTPPPKQVQKVVEVPQSLPRLFLEDPTCPMSPVVQSNLQLFSRHVNMGPQQVYKQTSASSSSKTPESKNKTPPLVHVVQPRTLQRYHSNLEDLTVTTWTIKETHQVLSPISSFRSLQNDYEDWNTFANGRPHLLKVKYPGDNRSIVIVEKAVPLKIVVQYLKTEKDELKKFQVWTVLHCIVKALSHLHICNKTHGYLNWLNIFVPCIKKSKFVHLEQTALVQIMREHTNIKSIAFDLFCFVSIALDLFDIVFSGKKICIDEDYFPKWNERSLYLKKIQSGSWLDEDEKKILFLTLDPDPSLFAVLAAIEKKIKSFQLSLIVSEQALKLFIVEGKKHTRQLSI